MRFSDGSVHTTSRTVGPWMRVIKCLATLILSMAFLGCADKDHGSSVLVLVDHSGCNQIYDDWFALVQGTEIEVYNGAQACLSGTEDFTLRFDGDYMDVQGSGGTARIIYDGRWAPTGQIYVRVEQ